MARLWSAASHSSTACKYGCDNKHGFRKGHQGDWRRLQLHPASNLVFVDDIRWFACPTSGINQHSGLHLRKGRCQKRGMSLNNLLHNYRFALLVWWPGLLSAHLTAADGLIKNLQCFIRGEGGNRTTSLPSKASYMDQQSGNDLRQRDGLRPEREDAHLDPVLAILRDRCCLECCLPKAANRQSTRHHRPINQRCSDPGYLAKCLVMPLITLFHNAKSSRSANFHDQSTVMTAWRDGYTIATSKPSASETATSMPYTSSKFHLIERRKEVSKHLRYGSSAQINQRITRFEGANTDMKKLPYLVRCHNIGDQDVRARKRSSLAAR
ncbi:hypothetical protein M438DRAFT_353875 [Aureobasidium pullulans EXF-150]|uniref:Uncharacterized protein n=1 Tax=Aureobasidium pullulans EXF-150 TaxID=1043002 RepID=A0A074XJN4_AURPU|nr:uncharacterized protein M438DRAFT_353875 [Aureobasidium pullulans EXF-150]KEQ85703.1 hypothetical protein M438DRAFT_353875 [Aureobasidium pullulans EXF-150]